MHLKMFRITAPILLLLLAMDSNAQISKEIAIPVVRHTIALKSIIPMLISNRL